MRTILVILILAVCALAILAAIAVEGRAHDPFTLVGDVPVGTYEIYVDNSSGLASAVGSAVKNSAIMINPGTYNVDKLDLDVQAWYVGTVPDPWAQIWKGQDTLWSTVNLTNGDTVTFEYLTFWTTGSGDWARLGASKYLVFRHCNIMCSTATILANGDTIIWEDIQLYPLSWTATARIQTTGNDVGGGLLKGSNVRVNNHWWNHTGQKMFGLYFNGGTTEFDNFWCFVPDCTAIQMQGGALTILGNESWIYGGPGNVEAKELAVELLGAALDTCSFSMEGGTIVNFDSSAAAGTVKVTGTSSVVLENVTIKNKSGEAEANAYYSSSTGASRLINCIFQGGNGTQNNYTLGANDEIPGWNIAYNKTEGKYLAFFQGDSTRIGSGGTAFNAIYLAAGLFDGANTADTITTDVNGATFTTFNGRTILPFFQIKENAADTTAIELYIVDLDYSGSNDRIRVQRSAATPSNMDYNAFIIAY